MQRNTPGAILAAWAIAILAIVVLSPAARANLVGNPGFETAGGSAADAAVWTEAINGHTAERSNTLAHTGDWSIYFNVGPVNNNAGANNANLSQNSIPVGPIAGKLVELTGWALNPGAEPLIGSTEKVELRIWFYTASNSLINFITSTLLDQNSATDTWQFGSISGIAPAGTEKLNAQIIFRTDPNNQTTGSAFVDDITLTVAPEPASFALLALGVPALLRRRRR